MVPPRYMLALTSFVQTNIWSALFQALPQQPDEVRRMGLAWNKMLVIQLEMFLKAINARAQHVPYRGSAAALTGVIAGDIQMMMVDLAIAIPQIREGKVKISAGVE